MEDKLRVLKPRETWAKFSRKKSWLWNKVKNDPDFPKPIYLDPGAPVFIERELNEYLLKLASQRSREDAGPQHISVVLDALTKAGPLARLGKVRRKEAI